MNPEYDYAGEAVAWYEAADTTEEEELDNPEGQTAAALCSIAASLIRIGDMLEAMKEG